MTIDRMDFGIFLAPFHPAGENPTLALRRDLDLVAHLDRLGYDEVWAGEHHSGGWELISSPELFLAAAGERTTRILLGTGVVSLPYHHPFHVADRIVLLDHLTQGRAMLGVGPGALAGDAAFLGIEPTTQRDRMDEALGVIMRLLTEDEPITYKSDWFELNEAQIQLKPYQRPTLPIAVAATVTPTGMVAAGKHNIGVLSVATYTQAGVGAISDQWRYAEQSAKDNGQPPPDRGKWRLVIPFHLAATREQAIQDVEAGAERWFNEYMINTLGSSMLQPVPNGRVLIEGMNAFGGGVIGTPDDAIECIKKLQALSGGFGALLGLSHEWTEREKIWHSYELFARYVMPEFQDTTRGTRQSIAWTIENKASLQAGRDAALEKAMRQHAAPSAQDGA
jgi:limonene 1,2-monooxygenase